MTPTYTEDRQMKQTRRRSGMNVMLSASIPVEMAVALRASADANDRSLSAELRVALREHLGFDATARAALADGPGGDR